MQKRSFSGAPRSGGSRGGFRPKTGAPSGGRSGGFRGGRSGGNRGGGSGRRFQDATLHFSKFINKAKPNEPVKEYEPKNLFNDFVISESIKKNIARKNYIKPSPIQDQAIPSILEGRDLVGLANTGTGKTAAFLIPLLEKVLKDPNEMVLIMAPTRELAIQIEDELKGFSHGMKVFSACCVGGAFIGKQIRDLKYKNNFVIGTPGRLKDLMERGALDLSKFRNVVLDEADRMLDMGFIADMKFMLAKMPKERQTLFFSATLSKEIERLINDFLTNPVMVSVKTRDTAESIDQDIVRVGRDKTKIDVLHDLLKDVEFKKVLVFGKTKHGVERLGKELLMRGITAESIHGDKRQAKRQQALGLFKDNKIQVLVATDVAARGIDVSDISHVINFDLPSTYEDYVHRIGRTGRGGKSGKALTFVDHH
ncbi:MAG: DEAD/DEAH box helicase [Candidatus Pacebacteria bacterium]|jgi:superfamily II DNA/RNA helicase|nr:DEAD/DEAH box helicase [Candidatus Paceibacterota bacterium]MBP9058399.1 DEAD/DEAH box helicase [Candidatus Paceibacterota bacterium]MBP9769860.1 DEAD/DEAH box helicase [Candidatus Paceibacterota bacterium]